MGKKVKTSAKPNTNKVREDAIMQGLSSYDPQKMFFNATFNMGWQLAVAVLLPVFIGVELDKRFDSSPSYVLASLVVAVFGVVIIVKNNVNQVTQDLENEEKKLKGKTNAK